MFINRRFAPKGVIRFSGFFVLLYLLWAAGVVGLHHYLHWEWLSVPWLPISLIGIAVAFFVGFKNNSSYDRLWEARKIWGAIVNSSRSWGIQVKDYVCNTFTDNPVSAEKLHSIHQELIYRHIAWLYALRRQLWKKQPWEHYNKGAQGSRNLRKHYYDVDIVSEEIAPFVSKEEKEYLLARKNIATHLVAKQSERLRELRDQRLIDDFRHINMQNMLIDFYTQQGKCERIKNFPFPRQYASTSSMFVWLFLFLVPFGMLNAFHDVAVHSHKIWLAVPFCGLVGWVFFMMETVGDYSENPFEGLPNDIPTDALTRTIEIDMREMLGETELPPPVKPLNNFLT